LERFASTIDACFARMPEHTEKTDCGNKRATVQARVERRSGRGRVETGVLPLPPLCDLWLQTVSRVGARGGRAGAFISLEHNSGAVGQQFRAPER
jgi:hypothetical protein